VPKCEFMAIICSLEQNFHKSKAFTVMAKAEAKARVCSVEANKDTRYRVFTDMVNSRCFILMKNRMRPDSQLFNSWGCNSWGRGMRCSPPQLTRGSGEWHKLPQRGSGQRPGLKTSFGVFRA